MEVRFTLPKMPEHRIDGSLVMEKQMANFRGSYQEEIDMSGLSTGVYFINVISGETMIHEKLILTK